MLQLRLASGSSIASRQVAFAPTQLRGYNDNCSKSHLIAVGAMNIQRA